MAMLDAICANGILALLLNDAAFSAVTATNLLLGTNTPTAISNMSQLSSAGYTTGGSSVTWNPVSGQATSNSNVISWTNTSGSSWNLVGLEIWNSGATVRYLWGTWTNQPVTVSAGNTFQVSAAAIQVSLL
jgi:hypothetical protein